MSRTKLIAVAASAEMGLMRRMGLRICRISSLSPIAFQMIGPPALFQIPIRVDILSAVDRQCAIWFALIFVTTTSHVHARHPVA